MNALSVKLSLYDRQGHRESYAGIKNLFSIIHRFQHYRDLDLFRLNVDDVRPICQADDSMKICLYNELNEKIVPPVKTFYVKFGPQPAFSAIYLHSLTRKDFEEKLLEHLRPSETKNRQFFLELKHIRIRIDTDNVVKYSVPDEARFSLTTLQDEILLSLINDASL